MLVGVEALGRAGKKEEDLQVVPSNFPRCLFSLKNIHSYFRFSREIQAFLGQCLSGSLWYASLIWFQCLSNCSFRLFSKRQYLN